MTSTKAIPHKRKLRNFLIYPRFQLGLLAIQAVTIALTFAVVEIENGAAFARMAKMGSDVGLAPDNAYFIFVNDQAHCFLVQTSMAFLTALIISSSMTLYLFFRLADPIYRLRKHLRQIADHGADGIEPLRFRNGDFYSDLPGVMNKAVDRLKRIGSGTS